MCVPIGLGMPLKYWLLSYVLSIIYGFFNLNATINPGSYYAYGEVESNKDTIEKMIPVKTKYILPIRIQFKE